MSEHAHLNVVRLEQERVDLHWPFEVLKDGSKECEDVEPGGAEGLGQHTDLEGHEGRQSKHRGV